MDQVFAVDGDTLAYRTAAVCEDHFEGAAYSILASTLREIATETGVTKFRLYISGKSNFRYDIAKTKPYKGNRATMVRPRYLEACKNHLCEKYGAIVVDGYEADDAIATDMTLTGAYHCGVDKDILQIAGKHYNYVKKEWITISEEEATLRLYRQILMGDTSDNIPGLPRVGEKIAHDTIQDASTALQDAMAKYEEVVSLRMPGVNWLEYMAEQMELVRMRRDLELYCIDFNTFTIVEPNSEGFESHEGGMVATAEPIAKRSLKL